MSPNATLPDRPAAERPPTFLVGAERSGTTLLRLMLDGHPMLAFRYEFELAVDLVPDDEGWPALDAYYEFLRTFRWVDPPPHVDRTLDYPSLVRSFLEQKRARDGKPCVGAVVHRHFDRLLRIWPDARFVHIVRDPRDVARSCIDMGWAGNVWTGVGMWVEVEELWDRMRELLPAERRHEVRYEDLVVDAPGTLAGICRFVGLPYSAEMLEYPRRSTYRAPDPSLRERWRTALTARQLALIEARAGEMLIARGYSPSGLPPRAPTPIERAALRAHCRAGRARFHARSLGVRLWLERAVSERTGPAWWRDAVRSRVNSRTNAQIAAQRY